VAGASNGVVGRYIVVLRGAADPPAVANEHATKYGASVSHVYVAALHGYAATIPDARLAAVRADPRVAFISADREVHAIAQSLPTGINRIEGDLSSQLSGNGSGSVSGPAVAVIDTGSGPHTDLNIAGGVNCSTGRRTNFNDGNGHGTHVAGTIGAKDDGSGVVGVAPGVSIYSVRVLNNAGSGSWASVTCGIDWVTANAASKGIKVANMSLGGSGSDDGNCGNSNNDALHLAICNSVAAGVTYVVAAGNSNADFAGFVPAAYNEVLTVTAEADFNGQPDGGAAGTCRADVDDTAADFSNFTTVGSSDVGHTIAAPGVCILSTWKGGGYNTISGTSMASPHVAGTAALCLSTANCSGMTPAQVRTKLLGDAATQPAIYGFIDDPNMPNGNRYYGYLVYAGGY
jgi:subtilisin family serine protease